jgi:small subunit ribosomal protein S15
MAGKPVRMARYFLTVRHLGEKVVANPAVAAGVLKEYQLHEKDTGSVEAQVALLTFNIKRLTEHFKTHNHDHHSRRGLLNQVSRRNKLLKYLRSEDVARYRDLIKRLSIRDKF